MDALTLVVNTLITISAFAIVIYFGVRSARSSAKEVPWSRFSERFGVTRCPINGGVWRSFRVMDKKFGKRIWLSTARICIDPKGDVGVRQIFPFKSIYGDAYIERGDIERVSIGWAFDRWRLVPCEDLYIDLPKSLSTVLAKLPEKKEDVRV